MGIPDYTDVERMIFRGFLVEPSEVAGVPVVFKTINQNEYDLALLYARSSDPKQQSLLQECYFVAASVYLFNRTSVLNNREQFYHDFVDILVDMPEPARLHILTRLQKLNARALDAVRRVEGFCYGLDSRQRWALYKTSLPNHTSVTGIPGTEALGLNVHQRLWFHYNHADDRREVEESAWDRTKFQASVHSKEISKIDSQDKTRRRDEYRRREAVYLGEDPEVGTQGVNGEVKVSHESADDLLGQLKRDIEGQKDFHDKVVEAHERKLREQWERSEAIKAQRAIEARKRQSERFDQDLKDPVIFYDEEAVKQISEQRKVAKRQALARGDFADESARAGQKERLRKWGILGESEPERSEPEHPLGNTLLDDYYDVQMPDMSDRSPFDDE